MNLINTTIAAVGLFAMSVAHAGILQQLIIDDTNGNTAIIDVDELGVVTCGGSCLSLIFPAILTPHTTLVVAGTLGQFTIHITAVGGLDAAPALQTLTQINAAAVGSGTLKTVFTDTDYCFGGGVCFGPAFEVGLTNNPISAIKTSGTNFSVFNGSTNAVPAGTLVGSQPLAGTAAYANIYPNPTNLTAGSLSTVTTTVFSAKGAVASTVQVSAAKLPCSERDRRAGLCQ